MTDRNISTENDLAPPSPPKLAQWFYKRGAEIAAIHVELVPTGTDTSKTVWHLQFHDGSKSTIDETRELAELLDFYPSIEVPSWRAIASLKKRYREMCETREKWEKANDRELATYKRLKAKFEGATS